jgi:hypothetical protein
MNVAIIRDIALCSPYVSRCFGGTYHLHLQGRKSAMEETSDHQVARARHYISEDGNIHHFMSIVNRFIIFFL